MPARKRSYHPDGERDLASLIMGELGDYVRYRGPPEGFPAGTALLVVDMQRYFLDEVSHAFLPSGRDVILNINALSKALVAQGSPVVFSRHMHRDGEDTGALGRFWSDVLWQSDPLAELQPGLERPERARYVRKNTYDMFQDTELQGLLDEHKVQTVVVTGVMTHLCVETTARSAFVRGYDVIVPVDCCATSNWELHVSALRTLADGFARITSARELLDAMGGQE